MQDPSQATCLLCKSSCTKKIFAKGAHQIYQCLECDFVFTLQKPSLDIIKKLYSEQYFNDENGQGFGNYRLEKKAISRTSSFRLKQISLLKNDGKNILEVGCGMGFFLEAARRYYTVKGIEISDYACSYARNEFALDVVQGTILETSIEPMSFDIVAMWDVIEHLSDPVATIQEIHRVMAPKGLLSISTGDIGSFLCRLQGKSWRLYDPPYHLGYFSQKTIRDLLLKAGFEVIQIKRNWEWHSLGYLLHCLTVYYDKVFFKSLRRILVRAGAGKIIFPINLGDIMTVFALKRE